jgi:5-methylcytosine-specific restriction enzyme subunit McrC
VEDGAEKYTRMTVIQRFEHDTLTVGSLPEGGVFTEQQWLSLIRWQDKQEATYFTVIHKGLKFSQWVGILQTGNITIEILPKAERQKDLPREDLIIKWKRILYRMLHVSYNIDLRVIDDSKIRLQNHTIIDYVFQRFLEHADELIKHGLIKTYREVQANRKTLKGRLLVGRNEALNHVHRERLYTIASEYDQNNVWNQILHVSLMITARLARPDYLRSKARGLLLSFPDQLPRIDLKVFSRLQYGRRTEAYRPMVRYAELIIRHANPDMQGGANQVFGILFDMNRLWESWVLYCVRQAIPEHSRCIVVGQTIHQFWKYKKTVKVVKPDILIRYKDGRAPSILDSKWKVLDTPVPSDDDLKQMYVYEKLLGSVKSTLIYPEVYLMGVYQSTYVDEGHTLKMLFLDPAEKKTCINLADLQ